MTRKIVRENIAANNSRSFDATLGQVLRRLEMIERRLAALKEQPKPSRDGQ
jgi:hypothetical protein